MSSKNNNSFKRYLKIVCSIVGPFLLLWSLVIGYYLEEDTPNNKPPIHQGSTALKEPDPAKTPPTKVGEKLTSDKNNTSHNEEEVKIDLKEPPTEIAEKDDPLTIPKNHLTGAVFGLDESQLRTDVMMVGFYNTKTNVVDVFSLPRDARIEISKTLHQKFNQKRWTPKVMKLNELHAYAYCAKADSPEKYVISAMEEILGFEIDHNVVINTRAFNKVVDTIGGVKIYVPRNMQYYDPYQKLKIDIKKGEHVLDGNQAEGFVRYRSGYRNGDLGRIEMQQYFLKAFAASLLEWKNVFKLPAILNTLYENLRTDLTVGDITSYVTQYLDNIPSVQIRTHTIPGEAMYIGGVSYFVYQPEVVHDFVIDQLNTPTDKSAKSLNYRIQIVNGSYSDGMASKFEALLKQDSYQVVSISNYDGTRQPKTRIYVKDKGVGKDLIQYFNWAQVIVDPSQLQQGIDIKIVTGTSEN